MEDYDKSEKIEVETILRMMFTRENIFDINIEGVEHIDETEISQGFINQFKLTDEEKKNSHLVRLNDFFLRFIIRFEKNLLDTFDRFWKIYCSRNDRGSQSLSAKMEFMKSIYSQNFLPLFFLRNYLLNSLLVGEGLTKLLTRIKDIKIKNSKKNDDKISELMKMHLWKEEKDYLGKIKEFLADDFNIYILIKKTFEPLVILFKLDYEKDLKLMMRYKREMNKSKNRADGKFPEKSEVYKLINYLQIFHPEIYGNGFGWEAKACDMVGIRQSTYSGFEKTLSPEEKIELEEEVPKQKYQLLDAWKKYNLKMFKRKLR